MRSLKLLPPTLLLSTVLPLTLGACGDDGGGGDTADAALPEADAAIAPVFFTPRDDLSDQELATQALSLLGFEDSGLGGCQNCHGLTRQRLFHWRAISDESLGNCLTDLENTDPAVAKEMLDCLREQAGDADTSYYAPHLGIFTTGAHLDWFRFTFDRAYGADAEAEYEEFIARLAMPRGDAEPYTQEQFDIVASWFTRGAPLIDDLLPEDPAPTECTPGVSASVSAHIEEQKMSGWRAVNEQNNLLMFGCADATSSLDCLSSYPLAGDESFSAGWAVNVPEQKLRILRQSGYRSNFWTRSSADGRWVANGATTGGAPSRIVDLERNVSIPTSAFYDPGFFPDNSGFMFQRNQAYLCNQSLLVGEPEQIVFQNETDECLGTENVGLYQHVGASLGGGDYWAVDGQFESDNGGKSVTRSQPDASFSKGSTLSLTPIIHTGSVYDALDTIEVETPYEGDAVISASSELVISRLRGPEEEQLGFVMRKVEATATETGYDIELPEVARYCINGGKPAFSYDERWMVLHHYTEDSDATELGFASAEDPGFEEFRNLGSSDIYLIDTATGAATRITQMQPGQYALFPHFRSDGWIYFMVRTLGAGSEHIVASDAALRLEATE